MVGLGQAAALAYVDVEGNQVVPEARDAFLCTLNNLISNTNLQTANENYIAHYYNTSVSAVRISVQQISTILTVLFIVFIPIMHIGKAKSSTKALKSKMFQNSWGVTEIGLRTNLAVYSIQDVVVLLVGLLVVHQDVQVGREEVLDQAAQADHRGIAKYTKTNEDGSILLHHNPNLSFEMTQVI